MSSSYTNATFPLRLVDGRRLERRYRDVLLPGGTPTGSHAARGQGLRTCARANNTNGGAGRRELVTSIHTGES